LILSEPSNPWMSGVSNVFTHEFYQSIKDRLNDRGLLAQWIQTYSMTTAEYALIVRTVKGVFPHYGLIRVSEGDTMLLASTAPLKLDRGDVDALQAFVGSQPVIKADLEQRFDTNDVRALMLTHYLLDEPGVERLLAAHPSTGVNTDVNMRLEFDAPLHLFRMISAEEHVEPAILKACDASWAENCFTRWGCSAPQLEALKTIAKRFAANDQPEIARRLTKFALAIQPEGPYFMAEELRSSVAEADDRWHDMLSRLVELSAEETNRLGVALWQAKNHEPAITVFQRLIETHPTSATAWANLAVNYQAVEQHEKAAEALAKARSLDPANALAATLQKDSEGERSTEPPHSATVRETADSAF
jgi:tetratricopeptide (TPR) repeat protein